MSDVAMPYTYAGYGLGQVPEQIVGAGGSVSASVIAQGVAANTISASTAAIAIPVIGGVAAAAIIIMSWIRRRNAQKIAATHVVDEAEPFLEANRDEFLAGPATAPARAQALATFDAVWAQVVKECTAIGGGGGSRCISDRQPGGQWDWFAMYRTPIEQAELSGSSAPWGEAFSGGGASPVLALVGAGLLAWAVAS